jgi:DNA-binding LytR/AlgR family response regulator
VPLSRTRPLALPPDRKHREARRRNADPAADACARQVFAFLQQPAARERLLRALERQGTESGIVLPAPEATLRAALMHLTAPVASSPLRWIRASVGRTVHIIPVSRIDYLRSQDKYTMVGWRREGGPPCEAAVRVALNALLPRLDSERFQRVHRSTAVCLEAVRWVQRSSGETARVHLVGRPEILPVSRAYLHVFRQM